VCNTCNFDWNAMLRSLCVCVLRTYEAITNHIVRKSC
jgi:hypothetical protein